MLRCLTNGSFSGAPGKCLPRQQQHSETTKEMSTEGDRGNTKAVHKTDTCSPPQTTVTPHSPTTEREGPSPNPNGQKDLIWQVLVPFGIVSAVCIVLAVCIYKRCLQKRSDSFTNNSEHGDTKSPTNNASFEHANGLGLQELQYMQQDNIIGVKIDEKQSPETARSTNTLPNISNGLNCQPQDATVISEENISENQSLLGEPSVHLASSGLSNLKEPQSTRPNSTVINISDESSHADTMYSVNDPIRGSDPLL